MTNTHHLFVTGIAKALVVIAGATTPAYAQTAAPGTIVACSSTTGERQHCAADTSAGVALKRSTGSAACVYGKTWGFDTDGIWVSDGCAGEFVLGQTGSAPAPAALPPSEPDLSSYGALDASGSGVLLGRSKFGELMIGGYALVRYINQLPADQTFTDHLGNVHVIDPRNDVQFHRVKLDFRGWLGSPKLRYQITAWSVMSTNQTTLYGFLGFRFHKAFNIYGGINSIGGSRSLMGSHPFWLAHDRVMADEFFRPGFTGAVWANGEIVPGLFYNAAVGNNLSQLGLNARQLTRDLATGGSVWWMPTTKEFGPNGSYDDWEHHEKLATRFGVSTARSRENRFNQNDNPSPDNTQVRLADSLLLFQTGSLATDVTVESADFRVLAFDAGMKYRGIFLQAEVYNRWLDSFTADGPLPVASIHDSGFYVQGAFYPIKKKLEIYGATSWVFGDKDAGFSTSHEYIQGANYFPFDTRNHRVNFQVIEVDRSPASSLFGFYVGGQKGTTVSVAMSVLF
jgi:Protein of unknown function (DUF3011)